MCTRDFFLFIITVTNSFVQAPHTSLVMFPLHLKPQLVHTFLYTPWSPLQDSHSVSCHFLLMIMSVHLELRMHLDTLSTRSFFNDCIPFIILPLWTQLRKNTKQWKKSLSYFFLFIREKVGENVYCKFDIPLVLKLWLSG